VTAAGNFPPAEAADGSAAAKALSLVAIGFAVATASAVDFAVATALAAGFADATEFAVVGTDTTEFAVVGTWLGPIARPAASTPVSHVAVVAVSAVTVVAAVTVVVAAVVKIVAAVAAVDKPSDDGAGTLGTGGAKPQEVERGGGVPSQQQWKQ
jgi:hypothetical protein